MKWLFLVLSIFIQSVVLANPVLLTKEQINQSEMELKQIQNEGDLRLQNPFCVRDFIKLFSTNFFAQSDNKDSKFYSVNCHEDSFYETRFVCDVGIRKGLQDKGIIKKPCELKKQVIAQPVYSDYERGYQAGQKSCEDISSSPSSEFEIGYRDGVITCGKVRCTMRTTGNATQPCTGRNNRDYRCRYIDYTQHGEGSGRTTEEAMEKMINNCEANMREEYGYDGNILYSHNQDNCVSVAARGYAKCNTL